MRNKVRLLVGLGLAAATAACAGRNLPPEPDSYVAADAIGAERAAELAASPAATWLDDLNAPEMSTLAREALAGSPDLQIVEARYRAARWRARGAIGSNLLPSLQVGVDGTRQEEPIANSSERLRTELAAVVPEAVCWAGIACYPTHVFHAGEAHDKAARALATARAHPQHRVEVARAD